MKHMITRKLGQEKNSFPVEQASSKVGAHAIGKVVVAQSAGRDDQTQVLDRFC